MVDININNNLFTVDDSGNLTLTVADTKNVAALSLVQNDTTNDPAVISIDNNALGPMMEIAGYGGIHAAGNISSGNFLDVGEYLGENFLSASSGTQVWVQINAAIDQSGTAGYTVLVVDADNTWGLGSGEQKLIDARVAGNSRFEVFYDGDTLTYGGIHIGSTVPDSTENWRLERSGGGIDSGTILSIEKYEASWDPVMAFQWIDVDAPPSGGT